MQLIITMLLSFLFLGCSLEASLIGPSSLQPSGKGLEVVSMSQQNKVTPGQKVVSVSMGSSYKNLVGETSRGYKIYSTVQGQIVSVHGEESQ